MIMYLFIFGLILIGTAVTAAITAQEPEPKQNRMMILDKCKTPEMTDIYAQIFNNFTSAEWNDIQCLDAPYKQITINSSTVAEPWNLIGYLIENNNLIVGKIYGK